MLLFTSDGLSFSKFGCGELSGLTELSLVTFELVNGLGDGELSFLSNRFSKHIREQ